MKKEISQLLDTRGSLDMDGEGEEYCTVRHFSISGRKVVNRGDSFKVKRSTSGHSVTSMESSGGEVDSPPRRSPVPQATLQGAYEVAVIGASSVGKNSLISQFMTSEYRYLHGFDQGNCDDEERTVSVLLDGEESELTFTPMRDNVVEDKSNWRWMRGLVVVYSVTDRASFVRAQRVLETLVTAGAADGRAIILVANKIDLARSRLVSEQEGRILATACNCKYSEVSVVINHNVDELLVGLLAQIRFRTGADRSGQERGKRRKYRGSKTSASFRGLLSKLRIAKSHSCHKLHEL
ncbi:ras-related protein Rap1-like [Macrosteles quadrilineatus]|uniref:ras-related protein Rap1-like n=1 Tax=Macrosteles quadrilineatus TaxID=74068 RepID=UPI0023E2F93A|nr:ras-related protein Rap1-like [Macrosteles quadrilineatus]